MNNLYRRIVTMGMISFSAILAWVYCILAYREKTVYVVALSLVLVFSLYTLANAILSLHLAKQEENKRYITDIINQALAHLAPNQAEKQAELDRSLEAERLAKATYVQLRKVNQNLTQLTEASNYNSVKSIDNYTALTLSLKEALAESIANTAKIIIKYNKTDNQNIIEALNELSSKMQDINIALDEINTRIDSINIVAQPHVKTLLEDSVLDDTIPSGIDVFSITTETPKDTAPDISEAEEDAAVNSFFEEFEEKTASNDIQAEAVSSEAEISQGEPTDSNKILSQDDIEALFKAAMPIAEEATANNEPEVAPEPVVEESATEAPVVNEDPNRQLTPDEIAALFSASKEERAAKSDDDFHKDNMPEAMDQSLIDALLGNLNTESKVAEEATAGEDKIIPFPVAEEKTPDEPAPIAEEFDPNKQLSADEIAALFASINGGN